MQNCEDWIEITTNFQFILPRLERRFVSETLIYRLNRDSYSRKEDALNRLIELGYTLEESEKYLESLKVMRTTKHIKGFTFEL